MKRNRPRVTELNRRRKRREKYKKLRQKYISTKTQSEKEKILQKVNKIAPWLSPEEFLTGIQKNIKEGR